VADAGLRAGSGPDLETLRLAPKSGQERAERAFVTQGGWNRFSEALMGFLADRGERGAVKSSLAYIWKWEMLLFVGVATVSATVDEFRPRLVGGLRAQHPRSPSPGVSRNRPLGPRARPGHSSKSINDAPPPPSSGWARPRDVDGALSGHHGDGAAQPGRLSEPPVTGEERAT
jgi:hypothetical protein